MSNIVEIARSYIGKVKYEFGVHDLENGVSDCSGFTQAIFEKVGVSIAGYTEGVWLDESLKNISKNELQSGDLVFFKNTYDSGYVDGVSHIGIYSGNGNFIHCGSMGVVEESLYKNYWVSHYLGAKRVTENTTESTNTNTIKNNLMGLEWWGDIVVVVLSVLLLLGGTTFLVLGVKGTVLKEVL